MRNIPVHKLVDDILAQAKTIPVLTALLRRLFGACRKAGITLSRDKFQLGREVTFGGYVISDQGALPDPERVAAIQDFPAPKNHTELRSFLGMANQFSQFALDLSAASSTALRPLLQLNVPFIWMKEQEVEFNRIIRSHTPLRP